MGIGKQQLLDAAEVVDAWRVFPRGLFTTYALFLWDVHYAAAAGQVEQWYAALVWGGMAAMTKFYLDSGRDWARR